MASMEQERIIFYKPCTLLQPYIRYYWIFKSDRPLNTLTFPVGCPQIIFHLRDPLYIPELDSVQAPLTVSGQVNFSAHLSMAGSVEMVVVVFCPHAMSLFLKMPVSLFYNREVNGYDIGNAGLEELSKKLSECGHPALCISCIEEWLLSQISSTCPAVHHLERIDAAVRQLCMSPKTTVADLSAMACLGKKQFERTFRALVGMNPKEYAGVVRFQKALALMSRQAESEINQAQMAYACGYADQSHLIREFRKFCGFTPKALLQVARPYSDLFARPVE